MKIIITGATGFIGRALSVNLMEHGFSVWGTVRKLEDQSQLARTGMSSILAGDLSLDTDWCKILVGYDVVVHLASRVRIMSNTAVAPLVEFRRVNVDGTMRLARDAAAAGIKRFVFVSSIKVNGEGRASAYTERDMADPQEAYAISKWEAEQGLREIESATGMEVVCLRPPLVYGPGVGANFLRLMCLVEKGWPLPFGRINNCRSLLYLGNLIDAIRISLTHPTAAGKTFLLSDGEDVSSVELVHRLASLMGRPVRLLPVPVSLLRLGGVLVRRSAEVDRLLDSLTVNNTQIRQILGWRPSFSMDEGLRQTVAYFLQHCR